MEKVKMDQVEACLATIYRVLVNESLSQEEMEHLWVKFKNLELIIRSNTEARPIKETENSNEVYSTSRQVQQRFEQKSACRLAVEHARAKHALLREVVEEYNKEKKDV